MNDGTPASTTEPTAPPSPSPSQESTPLSLPETDDFGFDGGGADLDEAAIFQELDEAPPAPEAKQPVQPPQPQPVQQPQVQPTQPQPQQQQPVQGPATAEQVAESFRNWRATAEHVLSNSHYNLNQDDANQLNVDPGQVIPKLMSRVYLDAVTAAVNVIAQALPYSVMNTIETHNSYKRNEDEFFGEWPGLKGHGAEVVRVAQVYRHLNPSASKADFIRSVGAQVALALGLTAEQARGTRTVAPNTAGQRVLRHVPPAASARHMAQQPQRPANFFEQLAQDTEED